jgi:hypothetical protein
VSGAYNALCLIKTGADAKFQAQGANEQRIAIAQRWRIKNVLRLAQSRGLLFSGGSYPHEFSLLHFFAPGSASGFFRGDE